MWEWIWHMKLNEPFFGNVNVKLFGNDAGPPLVMSLELPTVVPVAMDVAPCGPGFHPFSDDPGGPGQPKFGGGPPGAGVSARTPFSHTVGIGFVALTGPGSATVAASGNVTVWISPPSWVVVVHFTESP